MASWEDTKSDIEKKTINGIRLVSYFEALGTAVAFAVGYNKTPEEGIGSIYNINAWGMTSEAIVKSQKYITFTGLHNDVNNDDTIKNLFTRESLGYTIPKYPDGKEALGYLTDPNIPYPVNAKLYDMACGRGISGSLKVYYSMPYPGTDPVKNMANVKVGTGTLPTYPNKSAGDNVTFMGLDMEKDPAAPFWKENNKVTAKYFMQYKMDGAWFDNMSPWDNFQPVLNGFGEWSEKLFNDFLSEKFTTEQIKEMGITDISKFNIRKYVWDKALAMGTNNPDDPNDIIYCSYKWMSDPIWNAYKVFKMNIGRTYLQDMYKSMKDAAAVAGYKDGFMVSGNDMPSLNHGWLEDGWLDVNGTEISTGYSLTFGSRGILNVPQGKMAILERAALETQSGPYSIIWFYADDALKNKVETGKVLLAEAFANSCFIKRADNTVGTDSSHKWLNDFAYKEETTFGTRYMNYDIAILNSTEDQLGATMPGSLQGDLDNQFHMQGLWGFSQALVDAHIPYRVIPTWKVSSQTLKTLHTLIMPNVEYIDDSMLPILEEFVNNGGRLVITGPAGLRKGFDGMLAMRDKALLSDLVGRDISKAPGVDMTASSGGDDTIYTNKVGKGEVVWVATPIGHNYFMNYDSRPNLLPKILTMVGGTTIFDGSKLPLTVGSFLWKSTDSSDLFVDLVNYNVDNAADKVTSAKDLTFKIKLPEGTIAVKALALSPDIDPKTANYESQITADVKDGWATVTIPEVKIYTSIKLSTKATGEKGGMDSTLLITLISLSVIAVGVAVFFVIKNKKNNVL